MPDPAILQLAGVLARMLARQHHGKTAAARRACQEVEMNRVAYPITLRPDDNGTILVTCPDLPELITFGDDDADAIRHARDALRAVAMIYAERGIVMPTPSTPAPGQPVVTIETPVVVPPIRESSRGSSENWLELLRRAEDESVARIGVDHFRAGRHPQSPFKRALLYRAGRVTGEVKAFAYRNASNFDACWDFGLLVLAMASDPDELCRSPEGDWREWVKANLTFMLRRAR